MKKEWVLIVVALSLVPAPPAAAEAFKARNLDGDVILVSSPTQNYLRRADGRRVALPLAATARVHSFAAVGEHWYAAAVAATASGKCLVLLRGAAEPERLAVPLRGEAAGLREPSLLVDSTGLCGLAWLEGEAVTRLTVRAARWVDGRWEEPRTIAPAGPGSQLALSATVLNDGSQLLVWAAYDGEDDEIMWSRWSGDAWSAPARVGSDNQVPDITPHLVATPGGALLAWSRYDGNDYRVTLAGFDGSSWSEPRTVGPKGSLYPTLSDGGQRPLMTYQKAVPRSWAVAELDPAGGIRRHVEIETMRPDPPIIGVVTTREISLLWIGEQQEVASTLVWSAAP
ncbi:MAG: hypothetical protein GY856_55180 [bacterium]|nr:hypothetical protein [bacterium]